MSYMEKLYQTVTKQGGVYEKFSHEERVVFDLIAAASFNRDKITQREIARSKFWLGCHPKYEEDVVSNKMETTTRKVRQVIRDLRIVHELPILSDRKGYSFPSCREDAEQYLEILEKKARASAAAYFETYQAMRDTLGVNSTYFEAQQSSLFTQ